MAFLAKIYIMRSYILFFSIISFTFSLFAQEIEQEHHVFYPGKIWSDNNGVHINAHGGGILYHAGKYYRYGEYKGDSTCWNLKVPSWECYRTEAGGVSCYSSKDLTNRKFEGVVLKAEQNGTTYDFSFGETPETMIAIGGTQSLTVISDNKFNKFNGSGVGVYATSNGKASKSTAVYHYFEYKNQEK
jgi:hypothetical protein